jgi:hypothetical protein
MRIMYLLIVTIIVMSGCSKKVKETVGIVTPGPNEYQVQRSKTLEVPPHYHLQKPVDFDHAQDIKPTHNQNLNDSERALLKEVKY